MGTNRIRFYEFGPFRLDVVERQLWRDGGEITLTPKAFGVLLTLVVDLRLKLQARRNRPAE